MNQNRSAFALGLSVLLAVVAFGIAAFQYASYDPGREETARQLAASQEDLLVFIDAFLDRRTGSLVVPPEEISRIGGSVVAESDDVYAEELAAIRELTAHREALSDLGERYDRFESEVSLLDAAVEDGVVTLTVDEQGKLYYTQLTGEEPEYTAWRTERAFVFAHDGSEWTLVSQQMTGEGKIPPANEPVI